MILCEDSEDDESYLIPSLLTEGETKLEPEVGHSDLVYYVNFVPFLPGLYVTIIYKVIINQFGKWQQKVQLFSVN